MDHRPSMSSYYIQRGITDSATAARLVPQQESPGNRPLPNSIMPFQVDARASTTGPTIPLEPSPYLISLDGVNIVASSNEPVKRKRGRPRKYGPDGAVSMASSHSVSRSSGTIVATPKKRGRPRGSVNKQRRGSAGESMSYSSGMRFTPRAITVAVGEDIASKIMLFSQLGPGPICVLSANGSVSSVTLCQPSSSCRIVTFEGQFEILCLSATCLVAGVQNQTGSLSVSLASPGGRVIGGTLGGALIAASPVQVIVGSFLWGKPKMKIKKKEAPEGTRAEDNDMAKNPDVASGISPDQNLISSFGVWTSSQALGMRDAHA